MKKIWLRRLTAAVLVLAAVFLIGRRIVPVSFHRLMPELSAPEQCRVNTFEWNESVALSDQETGTLLTLLDGLKYRYDGRAPGGVMKGLLYHLSFFQSEPAELRHLFVSRQLGIVYVNDCKYEMIGDTTPLLDFLGSLKQHT